jgi:hypothetical protein
MLLVFMDESLIHSLLAIATDYPAGGPIHFRLFTNNITPGRGDTLGSYTEAAWTGYAAVALGAGSFTIQSVVAHLGSIQAPGITFSNTSAGAQTAYGYFITTDSDTTVLAAARFDGAPLTLIPLVGTLVVTPILGDFSGNS